MMLFLRRLLLLLPGRRRQFDKEMEAEFAALKQFATRKELGNLTRAAEDTATAVGFPGLQGVMADVRYGFRSLRRDRAFAAAAILSLTIAIGANTAIFGLMNTLLWRHLPIHQPEQLVALQNTPQSYFTYRQFALHSGKAMQAVIAESFPKSVPVDDVNQVLVSFVSGNYFSTLGISAQVGRTLQATDEGAEPAAVLNDRYWRQAFGSDRNAIGRSMYIGKSRFRIVGVLPEQFTGLSVGDSPQLWLPITTLSTVQSGPDWLQEKNVNWLRLFGRLKEGVSLARAQAMLQPVSVQIDITRNQLAPTERERRAMLADSVLLTNASRGVSELRNRFSRPFEVVFGMFAAGLLLACVNITTLQAARADENRKEFAIRAAIGASRFRLARQCLVETLLFTLASALFALAVFRPAALIITSVMTTGVGTPVRLPVQADQNLLAFLVLICIVITVFCGLLPALQAARIRQNYRAMRIVGFTATLQVAISMILVTATCLFAANLAHLRRTDVGLSRDRLMQVQIDVSADKRIEAQSIRFDQEFRTRLMALPGITHVTYSQDGLYLGRNYEGGFELTKDAPEGEKHGSYDFVGPGFFSTLRSPILAGRDFSDQDAGSGTGVVIVNRSLAARFFPHHSPIGQPFFLSDGKERKSYRIIGVVDNLKETARSSRLSWYLLAAQHPVHAFASSYLLRSRLPTSEVQSSIRTLLHQQNSLIRMTEVKTADELFDATIESDRLLARLGWALGALALVLASVGLYGLLAYDAARRKKEIGIRAAVGAQQWHIVKLLLSQAALVVTVGLMAGSIAANLIARLCRNLIYELNAGDLRIEALAAAMLLAVALLAACVPTIRATRIDPGRVLRVD